MKMPHRVIGVTLLLATIGYAAAPPGRWRALKAEEVTHVAVLQSHLDQHASKGEFEQAAKMAEEIAEYRADRQGVGHWEAIDARYEMEEWQRLKKISRKNRDNIVHARKVTIEGMQLLNSGRNGEAEKLLRLALQRRISCLGDWHIDTAASYGNLAICLNVQGKHTEALPLYQKSLDIHKKILGDNHPATASSYNNLAQYFAVAVKFEESLRYHTKALDARKNVLGERHPGTAISYSAIGFTLHRQGKADQALPYYRKALEIRKQIFGINHADTARSSNNLAACLEANGKATEALPLYQQSVHTWKHVLGEDHPQTATGYNNMAGCLLTLGKTDEALALFQQSLKIRKTHFGENHPETAASYNNVATCFQAQGKPAEAFILFRKALEIEKNHFGEQHPRTGTSYNNVAYCLQQLGKTAEALPIYQKALEIRERTLGESHPDTAASYNNIAYCLQGQGRDTEAQPLFQKALRITLKIVGENHPDTIVGYNNLARCLEITGNPQKAHLLFQKALQINKHLFGDRHPMTAHCYNNLAMNLQELGKTREAQPLHQNALKIWKELVGEYHPSTALSYNNLGYCLESQRKFKESLVYYQKGLTISRRLRGEFHFDTAISYSNIARSLQQLQHLPESVEAWKNAQLGYEYSSLSVGRSGFERSQFMVSLISPHQGLAVAWIELKKPTQAWQMAESDLSRGLLDDLSMPDKPTSTDQKKSADYEQIQKQLLPLLIIQKPSETQQKQISALTDQRKKLEKTLAEAAVRRARKRVLPLSEVQKQLSPDSAIVFWLNIPRLQQHFGCIVRRKGEPHWVSLPGTGAKQQWTENDLSLLSRTLEALQDPTQANRLPSLLEAVRRQRLTHLEPHLKDIRHLIVLPTGMMSAFPVDVLSDRYIVSYAPSATIYAKQQQKHRAFEAKSALVLADPNFSREKGKESTAPTHGLLITSVLPMSLGSRLGLNPGDVLLEYDGKFLKTLDDLQYPNKEKQVLVTLWRGGRTAKGRIPGGNLGLTLDKRPVAEALIDWRKRHDKLMAFTRGKEWTSLPGTLIEARTLKTLIPEANLLLGSDASEHNLRVLATTDKLKTYRLLHLATHGEANAKLPLQTALILAQNKLPTSKEQEQHILSGKKPLEGKLTVEMILKEWNLDADLVVLSACETGLGQDTYREGMLGFTQALLQKGARSVLLTRWTVDDAATSLLMQRFYQNILGKRDGLMKPMLRADALKEAKTWLRNLSSTEAQKHLAVLLDSVPRGDRGKIIAAKKLRVPSPTKTDKKDRPFSHPFYWAAFILVGDPR